MTRQSLLRRLQRSADAVVRASVREIDRMIREGLTLEQVTDRLRTFRLPQSEAAQLERVVETAMNEILTARGSVINQLSGEDVEIVKAATKISFPKLQRAIRDDLIPAVQKAIALRSGADALMHDLRERKLAGARTLATTALAQFNNEITFSAADQTGTTKFLYSGPDGPTTRPFCKRHVGKVYTIEEIEAMDNGQGLSVRSSLGGYNCRHFWVAQPGAR